MGAQKRDLEKPIVKNRRHDHRNQGRRLPLSRRGHEQKMRQDELDDEPEKERQPDQSGTRVRTWSRRLCGAEGRLVRPRELV